MLCYINFIKIKKFLKVILAHNYVRKIKRASTNFRNTPGGWYCPYCEPVCSFYGQETDPQDTRISKE